MKKKKISEKNARLAVYLFKAIKELPKARRRLSDKGGKYYDAIHLQLMPAEMVDGDGQGGSHYFYLPPALGREVLDAVEKIVLREMARLNFRKPKS